MLKRNSIFCVLGFLLLSACSQPGIMADGFYYHATPENGAPGPEVGALGDDKFADHDTHAMAEKAIEDKLKEPK